MPLPSRIASVLRNLLRKSVVERDLDDELHAALATLEDRYVGEGIPREEARRMAVLDLGGIEQVKEEVRGERAGAALDATLADARYAWRGLLKAPAFTMVIVLTLALGVGANSAIFSVVHAMLLAPLPYRDADRLIFVWSDMTDAGYPRAPLSGPELADLRSRTSTVQSFGAIWANTVALTGDNNPEQLRIGIVTDDFFDVLGAEPALGRTFRPEDAAAGARPTIVLGWNIFQRRFGADATVVGRQILVNDRPTTVIGVMARSFRLLLPPDSSVPDDLQAFTPFGSRLTIGPRGQQYLRVIGRMKPGVTLAAAQADINTVAALISRQFTEYGAAGRLLNAVSLQQDDVREVRAALLALSAGVGILLTIACVNVANLLIARAVARRKETALRVALGAGRGRLLRQCLIEGLMLALLGVAAGISLGVVLLRGLYLLRPEALSRMDLSRFNAPVLAFTVAVAVVWGLLFSLAPLLEIFKTDAALSLQREGRGTGGPIRSRTRTGLVIVQLALSVVLLIGAALLVRTFLRVQQVDPGFRADRTLTFRIAVPFQRYRPPAGFNTFSKQLQAALVALPGVTGAGAISHVPYDALPNWGGGYQSDAAVDRAVAPNADYRSVTPGLLETLGVRLIEGRTFTESDADPSHPVVIVDDRLAHRMWPGRSAIDQHLLLDPGSNGAPAVRATIIGVVSHLRLRSLVADLTEQVYFPERLALRNPMAYVVRADRDTAALAADVRKAIAALDPNLPIYDVRTLDSYVEGARATRRFTMQLAVAFALVALALACVGVYGIIAYAVTRRRQEFGVRLALGAQPGRVVMEVVREGLRLAAAGLLVGIAAALVTSRLLASQLYGVRPHDPVSYAATIATLGFAAAIACWIPARRATAVSPMDALRTE